MIFDKAKGYYQGFKSDIGFIRAGGKFSGATAIGVTAAGGAVTTNEGRDPITASLGFVPFGIGAGLMVGGMAGKGLWASSTIASLKTIGAAQKIGEVTPFLDAADRATRAAARGRLDDLVKDAGMKVPAASAMTYEGLVKKFPTLEANIAGIVGTTPGAGALASLSPLQRLMVNESKIFEGVGIADMTGLASSFTEANNPAKQRLFNTLLEAAKSGDQDALRALSNIMGDTKRYAKIGDQAADLIGQIVQMPERRSGELITGAKLRELGGFGNLGVNELLQASNKLESNEPIFRIVGRGSKSGQIQELLLTHSASGHQINIPIGINQVATTGANEGNFWGVRNIITLDDVKKKNFAGVTPEQYISKRLADILADPNLGEEARHSAIAAEMKNASTVLEKARVWIGHNAASDPSLAKRKQAQALQRVFDPESAAKMRFGQGLPAGITRESIYKTLHESGFYIHSDYVFETPEAFKLANPELFFYQPKDQPLIMSTVNKAISVTGTENVAPRLLANEAYNQFSARTVLVTGAEVDFANRLRNLSMSDPRMAKIIGAGLSQEEILGLRKGMAGLQKGATKAGPEFRKVRVNRLKMFKSVTGKKIAALSPEIRSLWEAKDFTTEIKPGTFIGTTASGEVMRLSKKRYGKKIFLADLDTSSSGEFALLLRHEQGIKGAKAHTLAGGKAFVMDTFSETTRDAFVSGLRKVRSNEGIRDAFKRVLQWKGYEPGGAELLANLPDQGVHAGINMIGLINEGSKGSSNHPVILNGIIDALDTHIKGPLKDKIWQELKAAHISSTGLLPGATTAGMASAINKATAMIAEYTGKTQAQIEAGFRFSGSSPSGGAITDTMGVYTRVKSSEGFVIQAKRARLFEFAADIANRSQVRGGNKAASEFTRLWTAATSGEIADDMPIKIADSADAITRFRREANAGNFIVDLGADIGIRGADNQAVRFIAIPGMNSPFNGMNILSPEGETIKAQVTNLIQRMTRTATKSAYVSKRDYDDYNRLMGNIIDDFQRGRGVAIKGAFGRTFAATDLLSGHDPLTRQVALLDPQALLSAGPQGTGKAARKWTRKVGLMTDIATDAFLQFDTPSKAIAHIYQQYEAKNLLEVAGIYRHPIQGVQARYVIPIDNTQIKANLPHNFLATSQHFRIGDVPYDTDGDTAWGILAKSAEGRQELRRQMAHQEEIYQVLHRYRSPVLFEEGASNLDTLKKLGDAMLGEVSPAQYEPLMQKIHHAIGKFTYVDWAFENAADLLGETSAEFAGKTQVIGSAIRQASIGALKHQTVEGGAVLADQLADALRQGDRSKFVEAVSKIDIMEGGLDAFNTREGTKYASSLEALEGEFGQVFNRVFEDPETVGRMSRDFLTKIKKIPPGSDTEAVFKAITEKLTPQFGGLPDPGLIARGINKTSGADLSASSVAALNNAIQSGIKDSFTKHRKWFAGGLIGMAVVGMMMPAGTMKEPDADETTMGPAYGRQDGLRSGYGMDMPWGSPYKPHKDPARAVASSARGLSGSTHASQPRPSQGVGGKAHRNIAMSPERAQPTQRNTAPTPDNTAYSPRVLKATNVKQSILTNNEVIVQQVNKAPKLRVHNVVSSEEDAKRVQAQMAQVARTYMRNGQTNMNIHRQIQGMPQSDRIVQELLREDLLSG